MGENGLVLVDSITGTWGPAALLAVAIVMFLRGSILSSRTLKTIEAAKNAQIEALERSHDKALQSQKEYYEGRLAEARESDNERLEEVRKSRDAMEAALQVSVTNTTKLIAQVDELHELSRVATPVIVGQRAAAENHHD